MDKDPDVQFALASMQLEKLIIEPLHAAVDEEVFPPCIIIIDALDECKEENAISTILSALSVFIDRCFPLKFFITSRPVTSVVQGFRNPNLMRYTNSLVLHSIPSNISQKDIHVYLQERLSSIARSFGLKAWPLSEALAQLVEQSSGLFVFAATAANFIEDRNASHPKRQLGIVLSTGFIGATATSPHRHLDALYLSVLRGAFPDISTNQKASLQIVLGTIVLLFDPLGPESLEALLDLDESTVHLTLYHLHSIAIVPGAGGGPVRLIHPSFHDFLIDIERCNDPNFVVNATLQHTLLAERCLRVLQTLSPDMCKVGDPSICNREVVDLPVRVSTHIPPHVQYACRHWASHLVVGDIEDKMLNLLLDFCSNQLLNWLEVMSLFGELDGAIAALRAAHKTVKVRCLELSVISANQNCCSVIESGPS